MWKKRGILIILIVCLGLSACGNMMIDEPNIPMPKANKNLESKSKDNEETQKEQTDISQKNDLESGDLKNKAKTKTEKLLESMSLEEKVGQMFLARCPELKAIEKIRNYYLGGYLLFARDFKDKTKAEVMANIKDYHLNSKIPMWIGADEEGGIVNRVSRNPELRRTPFDSPQKLFRIGGMEKIKQDTKEKADLLLSLGINLNMAPVLDVPYSKNDFIYSRAVSTDITVVESYARQMVQDMKQYKLASVLKHFPGYGNNVDTHTEFAYDKRSIADLKGRDLKPFIAGIESGAEAILVSHNVILEMDEKYPASLSPKVHQFIREELQFDGVIMTDDLLMDAVKKLVSEEEAAVLAVLAGNDMLCSTSFEVQIPAVIQAVKEGRIPPERIDQAVLRVLKWKQNYLDLEI